MTPRSREAIVGAMRTLGGVILGLFTSVAAWAQTPPAPPPAAGPTAEGAPAEEPAPPPEPPPEPAKPPPPRRVAAEEHAAHRPEARTMGIGAGWSLGGTDLTIPNTASVRFRFPSGMALEPFVVVAISQTSQKREDPLFPDTEQTNSALDFTLGTQVRYPLASIGPVDFLFLGGVAAGFGHDEDDPNGPNNETKTNTLTIGLSWGLGLELFLGRRWTFSLDAMNPLFSVDRTSTEEMDVKNTSTTIAAGANFDPSVRGMFHLYFE